MSDPHPQPPRKRFHHVGLRAWEPQEREHHVPSSKCWVTNPHHHPHQVEYLRYAEDSPISEEFMNAPHIAYEVDELEPHLAGKEIVLAPFDVGDPLRHGGLHAGGRALH